MTALAAGPLHTGGSRMGSCEMTMTLSFVTAISISSASTPWAMAYSNAGIVFSGRRARAPRWPWTRMRGASAAPDAKEASSMIATVYLGMRFMWRRPPGNTPGGRVYLLENHLQRELNLPRRIGRADRSERRARSLRVREFRSSCGSAR